MEKLIIKGGKKLKGEVKVSGSKNAVLPVLAATLLTDKECIIKNVPNLRDIRTFIKILEFLGLKIDFKGNTLIKRAGRCSKLVAPYEFVRTMRASICVLGPMLARYGKANVSFPGGCVIGPRPIDLHLKGMRALGATVHVRGGDICVTAKGLFGTRLYLGGHFGSSVLATANVLMAATLARGMTVIENAACEPEIVDLMNFLVMMGARIKGIGTPTLRVEGVRKLNGCTYKVISDRIEAGTFLIAAAVTLGNITVLNAEESYLGALIDKLKEIGVKIESGSKGGIRVFGKRRIKSIDVTTLPYPGFPTDVQAQMMALLSVGDGISIITEKIFPDRFIHISELNRMGADIKLEGATAIVKGVKSLSGAQVMASDLRASAGLVLAGLAASGTTQVHRIYHLDRGYDSLDTKLNLLGASIRRESE